MPTNNAQLLTRREKEVILLIARGYSALSISLHLGCTEGTIKSHLRNARAKVEVYSGIQLVVWALKNDVVRLEEL